MDGLLDKIVENARSGTGTCAGCPATNAMQTDGESLSESVNPGLGHTDATLVFVTIEPSPAHGETINWNPTAGASTLSILRPTDQIMETRESSPED